MPIESGCQAIARADQGILQSKTLFNTDELEIVHFPGDGSKAIVAFAGIGMGLGGIALNDFRKPLNGSSNDIFLVKDKAKHWYSSFDKEA